jgi:hypothetical protein
MNIKIKMLWMKRKLLRLFQLLAIIIMWATYLKCLRLITNDEDNIRQVDSDNLGGKQRRQEVDASFDYLPSCMTLDRDSRLMDLDVYILECKELMK